MSPPRKSESRVTRRTLTIAALATGVALAAALMRLWPLAIAAALVVAALLLALVSHLLDLENVR